MNNSKKTKLSLRLQLFPLCIFSVLYANAIIVTKENNSRSTISLTKNEKAPPFLKASKNKECITENKESEKEIDYFTPLIIIECLSIGGIFICPNKKVAMACCGIGVSSGLLGISLGIYDLYKLQEPNKQSEKKRHYNTHLTLKNKCHKFILADNKVFITNQFFKG